MAGRTQDTSSKRCPACGMPVIRQWVGRVAALKVIADFAPISVEEARQLVEPNRLAWCVAELAGGGFELRWRCRTKCQHGLVIEHRCPPEAREYGAKPEGGLW